MQNKASPEFFETKDLLSESPFAQKKKEQALRKQM